MLFNFEAAVRDKMRSSERRPSIERIMNINPVGKGSAEICLRSLWTTKLVFRVADSDWSEKRRIKLRRSDEINFPSSAKSSNASADAVARWMDRYAPWNVHRRSLFRAATRP